MLKKILFLLSLTVLATAVISAPYTNSSGKKASYGGKFSKTPADVPSLYKQRNREWRAVWVATVENIDFPICKTQSKFQQEFNNILSVLKKHNANTVIFQVRSNCDAFYPSAYNPWSKWLTGKEGNKLGNFDPLKWMIDRTHAQGMEFHAWLNPFRVVSKTKLSKKAYLATLAPDNYARKNPSHVLSIELGGGARQLILDPGIPAVRTYIINTVTELVKKYNVDAVHFDDYFYPYDGLKTQDSTSYKRYNSGKLSLADWRRKNVDLVIEGVSKAIKKNRKTSKTLFGISPFGIWANKSNHAAGSLTGGKECYFTLYADVRKWMRNKWIDYVVPQLYWEFHHETAAYACLVDWWCAEARASGVKLWIGQGAYRVGEGHPQGELAAKLRYDSIRSNISGEAIFSYNVLSKPANTTQRKGVSEVLRKYWTRKVPTAR